MKLINYLEMRRNEKELAGTASHEGRTWCAKMLKN